MRRLSVADAWPRASALACLQAARRPAISSIDRPVVTLDASPSRKAPFEPVERRPIRLLDQQPVLALFVPAHADEIPAAFQPLAVQFEGEMALLQSGVRIAFRLPGASVPEHHRPAAIFAFRDRALEGAIGQGMILGPHRQPLVGRIEAGPFGHGPAQQNAVQFQPEIVMQTRGVVLLDQVRKLLVCAP